MAPKSKASKQERLIDLGAEALAEALLGLAEHNEQARNKVDLLLTPKKQLISKLKGRIQGLKRRTAFVDWRDCRNLSDDLLELLAEVKHTANTPEEGLDLLLAFYQADQATLERVDDSNGEIGDIFRYDANELFKEYASVCQDEALLLNVLEQLVEGDEFSVREEAIQSGIDQLSPSSLKALVERFWYRAEKTKDDYQKLRWYFGVKALALQLKDGGLFEKAASAMAPKASSGIRLDIASAYHQCGDSQKALEILANILDLPSHQQDQQDDLLILVHKALGNSEALAETAWRAFRSRREMGNLQVLLDAIGADQRLSVIEEAAGEIHQDQTLSYGHAQFLLEAGVPKEAAAYLLARQDQLDGAQYYSLFPMAEGLEEAGQALAATLC